MKNFNTFCNNLKELLEANNAISRPAKPPASNQSSKVGGAELAAEKGYRWNGKAWEDDRTGRKYNFNAGTNSFDEILGKEGAGKESGEQDGDQGKEVEPGGDTSAPTFSQFSSQMNRVVPGGPTTQALDAGDVEKVAIMLARGRWNVLSGPQKAQKRKEAEGFILKSREEKEVAAAAQVSPEPAPAAPAPKKPKGESDPGSMAQRMANDAEYENDLAKKGEDALLDIQTGPVEKKFPTIDDILQKAEKAKKPKKKKELSLPDRMAKAVEKNVPMENRDRDEANIMVDPNDDNSIFVPQPVPKGELKMVSTTTSPSPVFPLPGETEDAYIERKDDDFGKNVSKQEIRVPKGERRADFIFGNSSKTDLIGESAYMQCAFEFMSGNFDTDALELIGKKVLSPTEKDKLDSLYKSISEAIPSKGLGKGWEDASARAIKVTMQHMDPNRKYKFGKAGDYEDGMRLTSVPKDMMDFTYDRANNILLDKIGKEGIRKILNNNTSNIMDHYDPTDIVFFAEDAIQPFLDRVDQLSVEFDNSDSNNKELDLFNGIRKLKQEFINNKSLLPISLKKPKKGADPHFIPRNISGEYDETHLDDVGFDFIDDMKWGFDGRRMGDLTDNFNFGFNMKDSTYSGNRFDIPFINHPGTGPHANNPFSRVANNKSEPSLKGGANAKLGIVDTDWIGNPKVNKMLGYDFEKKYGLKDEGIGIDEVKKKTTTNKKARKFTDDERQNMKDLLKDVMSHEGKTKLSLKLPKGMNGDQFIDSLIDSDNFIHDELEGKTIRTGRRGQDAMDINLDDDQKSRVKEKLGSIPDANFRSKIRTKFRQLRYAKLMQELERTGNLEKFGKEFIYKNAMKIGNEFSPYILLG